uniref:BTB domain-containing protein n=1 Tax=Mycena chlorophos TaxID=658473 RepID=A0ABQ0LFT9_MYCCL|nr:predicted protein [Mycena chlorophos]
MSALHYGFYTRNIQSFRGLLDGNDRGTHTAGNAGGSSPRSKSFKGSSPLKAAATACDPNTLDWLGRSVLHLACAAPDALEYVRALLKHPLINVNLQDKEGHWTALHRALYHGNIAAALLLLQRSDVDTTLKDFEGHTAFDLYNTTMDGTGPRNASSAELHTWGVNRNAALGQDSGDRTYPELVPIPKEGPEPASTKRLLPLRVRQIQMAKLHTVVVTTERKSNLRVCGFGGGGRLGPGQQTQYRLIPVPIPASAEITSVALGQDHTLALTSAGEVYSWGLSRFHQLGYVVEPSPTAGRLDEPVQSVPRRIFGALKKEQVKGIAASKQSSACFTATEVFSWGTNNGQLGYDKAAQPYQVLPRKVSKISRPVVAIALNDYAMACLLDTQEVFCIWNDRCFKINFPTNAFPSEIQPYRPPHANAHIAKITSSDDTIAALSSSGELFTFSTPDPSEAASQAFKPQRVWALRKQFSAVRDVALGADGTIIICTESGHVFVRTRNAKSGQISSTKAFKFQRLPYLQRVTQVCANNAGAFGALRVDYRPDPIRVEGNTIAEDLAAIQPYLASPPPSFIKDENSPLPETPPSMFVSGDEHDEAEDTSVEADFIRLWRLCRLLKTGPVTPHRHGADVLVHVNGKDFAAHRAILAARSSGWRSVFAGKVLRDVNVIIKPSSSAGPIRTRLDVKGCSPIAVLILLEYLYSDDLLAIWDRRIISALQSELTAAKVKPMQVKSELQQLAKMLGLPLMEQALEAQARRAPSPSLNRDLLELFRAPEITAATVVPDVVLQLADREVTCHSAILRACSPVFSSFFDGPDWTAKRRDAQGVVKIDLRHMRWHVMEFVLQYMLCGAEAEMFENLEFAKSVDDALEFMFDVMAVADELLLNRLVLLCSEVILKWTDINNACYVLAEASYYHADQLVESIQGYLAANMETLLESNMLNDLTPALVKQLSRFVARKQTEKSPLARTGVVVHRAMEKHAAWLALQDIPEPIAPSSKNTSRRAPTSPELASKRRISGAMPVSASNSPVIAPQTAIDDIFEIDVTEPAMEALPVPSTSAPKAAAPVWKAASVQRVDMKAVMAEAAQRQTPAPQPKPTPPMAPRVGGSSPWKIPTTAGPGPNTTQSPPVTPSASLTRQSLAPPEAFPTLGLASPATPPRPRQTSHPSLGPVFTPTRQTPPAARPSPGSVRRVSSNNKAWTQTPPAAAPVPVPVASSSTSSSTATATASAAPSGVSFVAIQQLQLEQEQGAGRDNKKSLVDIQAEEEFLKWWAEEERRVKDELELEARSLAAAQTQTQTQNKSPKRPRRARNHGQHTQQQQRGHVMAASSK